MGKYVKNGMVVLIVILVLIAQFLQVQADNENEISDPISVIDTKSFDSKMIKGLMQKLSRG